MSTFTLAIIILGGFVLISAIFGAVAAAMNDSSFIEATIVAMFVILAFIALYFLVFSIILAIQKYATQL